MKNPFVFWTVAALALVAGFFLGKSEWFQNLFVTTKQSPPRPTSEGKACTTTGGKEGVIKNGVCTDAGGIPVDTNATERTNNTSTNSEESTRTMTCRNPVTGQQGTIGPSGECVPNVNSSSRIVNLANLSEQQRGVYNSIQNNPTQKMPASCELWISMVQHGASASALNDQWKLCSAEWGRSTQTPTAPNEILIPVNADCQKFTTTNPYTYLGCSYVFGGYVLDKGRRVCKLKKVSCP